MSRVFTITEGLENMGALKSGGQGSIYKAKRIGPIITAVKLLPTPILKEDPADKNYRDFQNEVEKLKKVNESPNPNVVRILNFGISETGSFPFIEMEFIEGPDLEDLLKPPHDPLFTIKETIKVAEHLSNALAHCHRMDVKHGDIKSNNIKFNAHTGNYVLLDFGLAAMSDEQRRTSLRHAGAIEFMAPEQSDGNTLFQTDVYSFGIILFELLTGTVPFPLQHKNETARNMVLVAHMETPPPDILPLRDKNIPSSWAKERRDHEMQVPAWLIDMIRKCLQKDPANRFTNGIEVYEYIQRHSIASADINAQAILLQQENKSLREENSQLRSKLLRAPSATQVPPPVIPPPAYDRGYKEQPRSNILSKIVPIACAALVAALILFFIFNDKPATRNKGVSLDTTDVMQKDDQSLTLPKKSKPKSTVSDSIQFKKPKPEPVPNQSKPVEQPEDRSSDERGGDDRNGRDDEYSRRRGGMHYLVNASRAYFHDYPNRNSRRNAYLTPSDEEMIARDEQGDFVYIEFTNEFGQTSRGWILKRDLIPIE